MFSKLFDSGKQNNMDAYIITMKGEESYVWFWNHYNLTGIHNYYKLIHLFWKPGSKYISWY